MPIAVELSAQSSAAQLSRACKNRSRLELASAIDGYRSLHSSRFVAIQPGCLAVALPVWLDRYRALLWGLGIQGHFISPLGQIHFETTVLPAQRPQSHSATASRALGLAAPTSLRLIKNPPYLWDSLSLQHQIHARFRPSSPDEAAHGTATWRILALASQGAACLADQPLASHCRHHLEGKMSFQPPGQTDPLHLRCTLQEIVNLDGSQSLVLLAFEQASRSQQHRQSIKRLVGLLEQWWLPCDEQSAALKGSRQRLTGQEARQLLQSLFEKHPPARIEAHSADQHIRDWTRLVALHGRRALLQVPPGASAPGSWLEPGRLVTVSVAAGSREVRFDSTILGCQSHCVAGSGPVQAIMLESPAQVVTGQRRGSFRTRVQTWPPVEAVLWPGQAEQWRELASGRRCLSNATLRDISAAGALVCSKPGGEELWDLAEAVLDQPLAVGLYLEPRRPPVVISARVRHKHRDGQSGSLLLGLQFVGLDESVSGRAVANRLSRFAAQMQRLQIRRRRAMLANQTPVALPG